jgi:transposase
MKTFGLLIPAGKVGTFKKNVRSLLADQNRLAFIVLPMLEAWRGIRVRAAELGRQLVRNARQSRACRIPHVDPWYQCDHRNLLHHNY